MIKKIFIDSDIILDVATGGMDTRTEIQIIPRRIFWDCLAELGRKRRRTKGT